MGSDNEPALRRDGNFAEGLRTASSEDEKATGREEADTGEPTLSADKGWQSNNITAARN